MTFSHNINHRDFKRYIPYANRVKDCGLLYVFGPKDISPLTKTIQGYHFNFSKEIWQPGEFPFPDVVIDRIYPNNSNAHAELEKVICQNKIFNKNNLINKVDFFKSLNRDSLLKNFVPETAPFLKKADLKYFLRKYGEVFLKPVDSMKGRGIIYVLAEGNTLICRYMHNREPVSERITWVNQIFSILERVNKRKRPYIIQAAVNRMAHLNRPFSFRTMVVKNGLGQWLIPAVFAKIAEPDGFLTNNSSGASFIPLKDLFKLIENEFPLNKEQCLDIFTDLSIKAAEVLDMDFGPLGKIGLDIVVDPSGKPWLIEANGNPGIIPRSVLGEYPDWSSQMYDYPLAYCQYLAGFGNN